MKAIVGGTIIHTHGIAPVKAGVILIEKGKIVAVGSRKEVKVPKSATVINARGKWIIPGLIDAHIHFFQSGGLYTRPDGLDLRKFRSYDDEMAEIKTSLTDTLARYLRCGITSVVDVGGPNWNFDVRRIARKERVSPRVAVAGPLISTFQPEAFKIDDPPIIQMNSVREARALVRQQMKQKPDLIKVWYIVRPGKTAEATFPMVKAVVDESHKNGLRVAVHATERETARLAVQAGADILVHSVFDKVLDQAFIDMMVEHKTLLTTTLMVHAGYHNVFSQAVEMRSEEYDWGNPYVTSTFFDLMEIPKADLPRRVLDLMKKQKSLKPNKIALKNLKLLWKAGVPVSAGTDAGNIGTLHGPALFRELSLMSMAGLSPIDILRATTLNGAMVMGKEKQLGSIERGKRADLVLLHADPTEHLDNVSQIALVIKDGVPFEPSEILKKRPVDIVQQQVNAYNAHDIENFVATYSPDIEIMSHPHPKPTLVGRDAMRKRYGPFFQASPKLHCKIVNRCQVGNTVVDQEYVTGAGGSKSDPLRCIAIYEVEEELIRRVWFIR